MERGSEDVYRLPSGDVVIYNERDRNLDGILIKGTGSYLSGPEIDDLIKILKQHRETQTFIPPKYRVTHTVGSGDPLYYITSEKSVVLDSVTKNPISYKSETAAQLVCNAMNEVAQTEEGE